MNTKVEFPNHTSFISWNVTDEWNYTSTDNNMRVYIHTQKKYLLIIARMSKYFPCKALLLLHLRENLKRSASLLQVIA